MNHQTTQEVLDIKAKLTKGENKMDERYRPRRIFGRTCTEIATIILAIVFVIVAIAKYVL